MVSKSITSRPLDLAYFIFFVTHIPIMLMVDLTPLYPAFVHEALPFLNALRAWYISNYRDRFFSAPPPFFKFFLGMEALIHIPVSAWAIGALAEDDPLVPAVLLPFATQVALTTGVCIVEYLAWDDFSRDEQIKLGQLYVPYFVLALGMGYDMFRRLSRSLRAGGSGGTESRKKRL